MLSSMSPTTIAGAGPYGLLKKIDTWIEKLSVFGLVIAIWGMLLLTLATIVLRWFQITFLWIDPLVRHLVFASGFMGGLLAVGVKQHIAVDLMTRFLVDKNKAHLLKNMDRIVDTVCVLTTLWLSWSSVQFVKDAFTYEGDVFLGIPSGVLVMIIPIGFLLMGYRFFFLFIKSFFEYDPNIHEHGHGHDHGAEEKVN